jgi:hypothetical protein
LTDDFNNTGEAVENVIGDIEDITVAKALVKSPSHFFMAERKLFMSCIQDLSFRRRSGKIDLDKVEIYYER